MTYPSWQTTRACIIVSIASLNLSAGTASAASRSSIILRTCMSRAAHPRVNAPPLAVPAPIIVLRQSAASVDRANRCNSVFGIADLLDYLECGRVCRRCRSVCGRRGGASAGSHAACRDQLPLGGSRASVERIDGSGSEPTYLPFTYTSCVASVL